MNADLCFSHYDFLARRIASDAKGIQRNFKEPSVQKSLRIERGGNGVAIIHFSLLGPFEAQVGTSRRQPLGDAMAAKILAFLAFHRRFCSKDEIIAACWGADKVDGKDKLDDEAYQKQVYKVRELFTDVLGLPWRDYFHSQSNGAELKDWMFTTDIAGFDALFDVGIATDQPTIARLDALQKADRYRRGVLLEGMHSDWIVSQAGARQEYRAKTQAMNQEIAKLQSGIDTSRQNPITFCDDFYQGLPHLCKAIEEACHEITFYGMDLRVTIPVIYDLLQDRLKAGVKVRFLLLNPDGRWPKDLAEVIGDEESTLRDECRTSLRKLTALSKHLTETSLLEIAIFDGPILGRIFGTDINHSGGKLFYSPYMNGTVPTRLPSYIWPHRHEGAYQFYAAALRQSWDSLRTLTA